ncbi:MAG TPA: DnaJ domain-containing protein [Blastocatellia bacterium]|nr:DnaJ domain-containing protein [Blastocatellia bacterium]
MKEPRNTARRLKLKNPQLKLWVLGIPELLVDVAGTSQKTIIRFQMALQKFDSSKNYYLVLGVSESASPDDLERAYRGAARKRHPDGGGSEEEMKSLNEAHDILSDPETRKAYDAERRPKREVYRSSMAFDPDAASRAGTLEVPVSDPDFAGLLMGAIACFGLGIPLLLLVEMQWVFVLWPLRVMSLGALVLGVLMAHAALAVKHRKMRRARPDYPRSVFAIRELIFWVLATAIVGGLVVLLYVA